MTRRARPTVAMIEAAEEESRFLNGQLALREADLVVQAKTQESLTQANKELRKGHDRLQRLIDDYAAEVASLRRQQEALIAALTLVEASRRNLAGELTATQGLLKQADALVVASARNEHAPL